MRLYVGRWNILVYSAHNGRCSIYVDLMGHNVDLSCVCECVCVSAREGERRGGCIHECECKIKTYSPIV